MAIADAGSSNATHVPAPTTDRTGPAACPQNKVERACKACRRSKKRCDRNQAPTQVCSHCIANGFQCDVGDGAHADDPPEILPHVKRLEERVLQMEELLTRLRPGGDVVPKRNGTAAKYRAPKRELHSVAPEMDRTLLSNSNNSKLTSARSLGGVPTGGGIEMRLEHLKKHPAHPRFVGESGDDRLLEVARIHRVSAGPSAARGPVNGRAPLPGRAEFWNPQPWENSVIEHRQQHSASNHYTFPDDDLVPALIELYFVNVNLFWPLLHRPTFADAVADSLHLHDDDFATVFILVCASGAQFSDDPRAFAEPGKPDSAGWQWFRQANISQDSFLALPSLYTIQAYCLAAMILRHTSASAAAWTLNGIGLRMAQDVGAHRRDVYGDKPSVRDELWKRAFWVMVGYDRGLSLAMGRQCAIMEEDFDLDLPIECDDEYWTNADPDLAFVQPPGKPSTVACFIRIARLGFITGTALRNLYSLKKADPMLASIPRRSDKQIVTDLDSALNEWKDALPEYLRWDAARADDTFFRQSVLLHVLYHCTRIMVHRNFIPTPKHQPSISLPSLAICTHAATATVHIMDTQLQRDGRPILQLAKHAFISATVLMLSIWGSTRSGIVIDPVKQMQDVRKCLDFMTACESRVYIAGRLADLVRELISAGSDRPAQGEDGREKAHATTADAQPTRVDIAVFPPGCPGLANSDPKTPVESAEISDACLTPPTSAAMDMDPAAVWSHVPSGNEPEEWSSYIEALALWQEPMI